MMGEDNSCCLSASTCMSDWKRACRRKKCAN